MLFRVSGKADKPNDLPEILLSREGTSKNQEIKEWSDRVIGWSRILNSKTVQLTEKVMKWIPTVMIVLEHLLNILLLPLTLLQHFLFLKKGCRYEVFEISPTINRCSS